MKPKRIVSTFTLIAVVFGGACLRRSAGVPGRSEQPSAQAVDERLKSLGYMADRQPAATSAAGQAEKPAGGPANTALAAMAASRKLIRAGTAVVDVPDYRQAEQALQRLAQRLGGYVADSQSERDDQGHEHGTLVLRVPAERFAEALAGTAALGSVRSQNVSAQDVTKAYADLETRLRVKRDAAERLREILKNRTAGLSDVLQAEQALARVVEEIEQAEGERRFYDQQVALSTLKVELHEPRAIVGTSAFGPLREAFRAAARVLAESLAAMVYLAAAAGPWLLLLFVLFRLVRARWRKRQARALQPAAS